MDKIAVLIPCYNEEKTIAKVVTNFKKVLPEATIYVYDNNSTDKSAELAKKAGAIVRPEYRQGKGNVVRSMFKDIDAHCYLMVDADNTYSPKQAREMCNLVLEKKADMVVGDRLSSEYYKENKRIFHSFGNRLVRFLINRLFKNNIKDIMSGYRAFSYQFVKRFPVLSKEFEIETEMTVYALDRNLLIREVPINYKDREEGSVSKLKTYRDGFKVLITILRLFKEYRPLRYFGSIFLIFSTISVILFIPVILEFLETRHVPRLPTFIFAGFMLVVGFVAFLCGIILHVVTKKHRILEELISHSIKEEDE